MATRHGVSVGQANEALADPEVLVFDPDCASVSAQRPVDWLVPKRRAAADGDHHYRGRRGVWRERVASQRR